jgi:hypothetical protein
MRLLWCKPEKVLRARNLHMRGLVAFTETPLPDPPEPDPCPLALTVAAACWPPPPRWPPDAGLAQTPIKFQLDWRFEGPAALFLASQAKGYYKAAGWT